MLAVFSFFSRAMASVTVQFLYLLKVSCLPIEGLRSSYALDPHFSDLVVIPSLASILLSIDQCNTIIAHRLLSILELMRC